MTNKLTWKQATVLMIVLFIIFVAGMSIFSVRYYNNSKDEAEKYKSISFKVTTEEEFRNVIENEEGYVVAYGNMSTTSPISSEYLEGKYIYLEEKQAEYRTTAEYNIMFETTMPVSKWVYRDAQERCVERVAFLGIGFEYGDIDFSASIEEGTVEIDDDHKVEYESVSSGEEGTLFCKVENSKVEEAKFYAGSTFEKVLESNTFSPTRMILNLLALWIIAILVFLGIALTLLASL